MQTRRSISVPTTRASPHKRQADIAIGAFSTVTGSVVVGPNVGTSILITVAEINANGVILADWRQDIRHALHGWIGGSDANRDARAGGDNGPDCDKAVPAGNVSV